MNQFKVYFSLPSSIKISGMKKTGIPCMNFTPYEIKTEIENYIHIKYKPESKWWNDFLRLNDLKMIYGLCDATEPKTPKYIGETVTPLKRMNQHLKEAVIFNNPSNKAEWIRYTQEKKIQVMLRPLMIVPYNNRLQHERIIRCMLYQLKFPLYNPSKPSSNMFSALENKKIELNTISPYLLQIINDTVSIRSTVRDKFVDSII